MVSPILFSLNHNSTASNMWFSKDFLFILQKHSTWRGFSVRLVFLANQEGRKISSLAASGGKFGAGPMPARHSVRALS